MKLTEEYIQRQTKRAIEHQERIKIDLKKYEEDSEKSERLAICTCKTCYYLKSGQIAGDAISKYTCRNCGNEEHHPNTAVPRYCQTCAENNACCVRCGSNI